MRKQFNLNLLSCQSNDPGVACKFRSLERGSHRQISRDIFGFSVQSQQQIMPSTTSVFSYSSAPQPIKPGKKYRNEDGLSLTLMSDPRVVRGTTNIAQPSSRKSSTVDGVTTSSNAPGSKRGALSKSNNQNTRSTINQSTYFFEVKKYCEEGLDLSTYLTEGTDRLPSSKAIDTQTDEFHRRPPTPEYIPRKIGIDTSTQIENNTELFNFDEEVDPILEIIMKKTLEQALLEVSAEEEMKAMGETILRYEVAASVESEWVKRREKDAIRLILLKDSEVVEVMVKNQDMHETTKKVAGLQLMSQLMDGIVDSISNELMEGGIWKDPLEVIMTTEAAALVFQGKAVYEAHSAAEEITNELLLMAERRYAEMAAYRPKPRRMELTIFLRGDNNLTDEVVDYSAEVEMVVDEREEDEDTELAEISNNEMVEGGDGSSSGSLPEEKDLLPDQHVEAQTSAVVSQDTSKSIGPIIVDEFDTVMSVEAKIMEELFRRNMADKKFRLYSYVVAALKGREFPLDACLLNFDLPPTLNIIV